MDGNGCSIGTHILSYKPVLRGLRVAGAFLLDKWQVVTRPIGIDRM